MTEKAQKILVHVCCAACLSHVATELKKASFSVVAFFYNPEIDDETEYDRRLVDLRQYCEDNKIPLIVPAYSPKELWNQVKPFKDKESIKYINDSSRYRRRRCQLCQAQFLQKTVEEAKKLKIKFLTTTFLCSPYKEHDLIIEVANEKALDYNLNFYYQDFRKGYWMGRNYARNHGIYISSFCGCNESLAERRLE